VFRLSPMIDPSIVHGMITINGGERIERSQLVEQGLVRSF
jgi:hypothetical protein